MVRRYYTTNRKTYAKGQADRIKGNRYMSTISLVSLKVEDVHESNPIDRTGEFYFEVDDHGLISGEKVRMPQHGEIHIEQNRTFTPKQPFTLWYELGFLGGCWQASLAMGCSMTKRDVRQIEFTIAESRAKY